MANNYYARQTNFVPLARARSGDVDSEFDAILAAFDLLPSVPGSLATGRVDFASEAQGATVNDYELTLPDPRTSNANGDSVVFRASHTNLGAATMKIDALAAVPVVRANGSATSGGELVSGLFYEARYDSANARFQLMRLDPATASAMTEVVGTSTDDPTAPGTFNALLPWKNANSDSLGYIGFLTDTTLHVANSVHGGSVSLQGENTAGASRTLLSADPDSSADLYYAGTKTFETIAAGILVSGTKSDLNGGASTADHIARTSAGGHALRAVQATGLGVLGQTDASGAYEKSWAEFARDGAASLFHNGTSRLSTSATGIGISGTLDDLDGGTATADRTTRNDIGGLASRIVAATGLATLSQTSAAGAVEESWIEMSRNGAVSLFYNGSSKLSTSNSGISVSGAIVDQNGGTATTYSRQRNDIGGIITGVFSATGLGVLGQSNAAGTLEESWVEMARDGSVSLFYNGTTRLSTISNGVSISGTLSELSAGAATGDIVARNSAGGLLARITVTTGLGVIGQSDASGAYEESWAEFARDGAVTLFHNGSARIATTSSGASLSGSLLDQDSGTATADQLVRNDIGGITKRVVTATGLGVIGQTDASGTYEESWIEAARNGAVSLFYNGAARLITQSDGGSVQGSGSGTPSAGAAQTSNLQLLNSGGVQAAILGFSSSANLSLQNDVYSGEVRLQGRDSGGTLNFIEVGDPDGPCWLYYAGVTEFRTSDHTASDKGTGAEVKDGLGTFQPIGFNVMPVFEQDISDIFDLAHSGMLWHKDANAGITFTCDNDSTIPVGATWVITNDDTEDLTVAQGTGVTLKWFDGLGTTPPTGNRTLAQAAVATVYKYTDTVFFIWGSGIS